MSTDPTAIPSPDEPHADGGPSGAHDDVSHDEAAAVGEVGDDNLNDDRLDDASDPDDDLDDLHDVDPKHLAPLVVDSTALHARVDELTAALHRYVDLAVGARAEFDAATVEDDPRIEAAEDEIGRLNAAVSEAFESELGLVSGHTTESWESDDLDDLDDDDLGTLVELTFTVSPGPLTTGDDPLERALEIVEDAADQVTTALEDAGYTVDGWSVSRDINLDLDDDD